jgi:hypothetical protein
MLNTCTLDAPQALPNYLARGFTIEREDQYPLDAGTASSGRTGSADDDAELTPNRPPPRPSPASRPASSPSAGLPTARPIGLRLTQARHAASRAAPTRPLTAIPVSQAGFGSRSRRLSRERS